MKKVKGIIGFRSFKTLKQQVKEFFACRQHPIRILGYTTKSFWLLLIPLTRSLVAMRFDIAQWLKGWWLDILVITVIFAYAFFRWFFITFRIHSDHITARTGYFGLCRTKIYYSTACSVSFSQGAFYRMFRAYKLFIDTNSGNSSSSDLTLTFKKSDFEKLLASAKNSDPSGRKFSYTPKRFSVFIFSLVFSSTLSGVILFATLIIQASRIIGRELEERFLHTVNEYAQKLAIRLPRYVVMIALIVILGWLYSFLVNLFRHWSFALSRRGDRIIIQSGIVTKRTHVISADKINYFDIQQSFLMKMFSICSVHIQCAGYGKGRREIAALIPISTFSEVESTLKLIAPEVPLPEMTLHSRPRNIMRFLWPPIWMAMLLPIADYVLISLFPGWREVIRFVAVIGEIPCVWLLAVKFSAAFLTGAGDSDGHLSLSFCKYYGFHRIIVDKSKISKVTVFQSPTQYLFKNCTLVFYTFGESISSHKVKNLPLSEAMDFLAQSGLMN